MARRDELGDRFKRLEEDFSHHINWSAYPYAVVRVDGRAFHTLTRTLEKPFDPEFTRAMDDAARAIARSMPDGIILAYIQSDEISVILDTRRLPFNGRVEKLLTVMASSAAVGFVQSLACCGIRSKQRIAMGRDVAFDARIIAIRTIQDVKDYLSWRRLDSMRNAISSMAVAKFGHKALLGKGTRERWDMLETTGLLPMDDGDYYGRILGRITWEKDLPDGDVAQRHAWDVMPAPRWRTESMLDEWRRSPRAMKAKLSDAMDDVAERYPNTLGLLRDE